MSSTWPPVTYEQLVWLIEEGGDASRSSDDRTYNSALIPPIADEIMLIPSECALVSEDVRTAIAAFDLRVGDTLAPLEALLVRIEASASSKIENVAAPVPDLLLAEVGDERGRSVADVIGNVDATTAAIVLSDEITPETILDIHRALLQDTHPVLAGRWRTDPVWIGSFSGGPPKATFVPPAARRVPDAMEDLCEFIGRTDMPVFIQAMVMHAQFETIHPFPDGNGRVGRALIHAMLRRDGLTKAATLPLSAGIVSQKHRYIDALTEYRHGDFVPIVELGADATFAALRSATELFGDVQRMLARWELTLSEFRSDSAVHPVSQALLAHPVVDARSMAESVGIGLSAVTDAIKRLEERRILDPIDPTADGRPRWVVNDIIKVLNDFTSRSINPFGRH
ncbi:MAG: Fic family protein [Ilumatobacter sp.]|uniref:Fic family protein n=1 Tax=Ilumatobacter sp. TaxID=1967498 RepID=UPI00391936B2